MGANSEAMSKKVLSEGMTLANGRWKKYTEALVAGYKKSHDGQQPPANVISTTAIMLENTRKYINRMDEATRVQNLGNFIDYGFGIVTAVMPALVANRIVSVQPLKARTGEIFFFDFKYGTNKGNIKKGDTMLGALNGANSDTTYSSEEVPGEEIATLTAETTAQTVETQLSFKPVKPGSVSISGGNFSLVDDGEGAITTENGTSNLTSGTIDYETGQIKLVFSSTAAGQLAANYRFDYSNAGPGANIPEVDIDLSSTTITTVTRSLRARWLFDAAYELQEEHGLDADAELSAALAAEVRHEIDGEIMDDIHASAQAGGIVFTWNKRPQQGVSYKDHKDSFIDTVIGMSNAIFADTRRAEGNFIIGGVNVCTILESMGGRFVPDKEGVKAGPHVCGTFDNRWMVIKDPYYGADDFVVGYKGSSYLEGGYVYAPFLPLFTTPTIMLDDFVNRKGVRTRYGKKMINPKFYAKGKVIDVPVNEDTTPAAGEDTKKN